MSVHSRNTTPVTERERGPSGVQTHTGRDGRHLPILLLKSKSTSLPSSPCGRVSSFFQAVTFELGAWNRGVSGGRRWKGAWRWLRRPLRGIPLLSHEVLGGQHCSFHAQQAPLRPATGGSFILQALAKSFPARCQRWAGRRVRGGEGSCRVCR